MPETPRSSFRLKPLTLQQIDRIGRARDGLTRTRVLELAVDALYRRIFPGETRQTARPQTERN